MPRIPSQALGIRSDERELDPIKTVSSSIAFPPCALHSGASQAELGE